MNHFVFLSEPAVESPAQAWIRRNFWLAFWLITVVTAFSVIGAALNWEGLVRFYGREGWAAKYLMKALGFVVIQLILWVQIFQYAGNEARLWAAVMSLLIFAGLAIEVGRASIDIPASETHMLLLGYAGGSYLVYGLFGSRVRV